MFGFQEMWQMQLIDLCLWQCIQTRAVNLLIHTYVLYAQQHEH